MNQLKWRWMGHMLRDTQIKWSTLVTQLCLNLLSKGKRRSVPAAIIRPSRDLIPATFSNGWGNTKRAVASGRESTTVNHASTKHNGEPRPLHQAGSGCQERHFDRRDSFRDDDSGRLTASSSSSGSKRAQLEELKKEVLDLVMEHPSGLWCTELMKVYSERHGRELNFTRFGYTSILSLAGCVEGVAVTADGARGDWLLSDAACAPLPHSPAPRVLPRAPQRPKLPADPEDALPGIPYAPDVFPEDCLGLADCIPAASLAGVAVEDMLEVTVGEVYSPSHFWLQRLGEDYNIAMENIMDDMNCYYERGAGKERRLSAAAVRVGFYCTSRYDGDWHRSLIVRILDVDTVKVRHVDYGTVERCQASGLRPLRREWGALPAQAIRARLAGVRPVAAGRRWPRAACLYFLRLVQEKRLVARVTALDSQDDMLEVHLIDTSTEEDHYMTTELINAEQADPRPDAALGTSECYLFPRFEALESGAAPNFAEVHTYVRAGIELDFVDDYRRHVPPCLPPARDLGAALMPYYRAQGTRSSLDLPDTPRSCSPADRPRTRATCNSRDSPQKLLKYKSCETPLTEASCTPVAQWSYNSGETPLTQASCKRSETHLTQAGYTPSAAPTSTQVSPDAWETPLTPASHGCSGVPSSASAPLTDGVWLTKGEVFAYITLYNENPQKGHYYLMGTILRQFAAGRRLEQAPPGFPDNRSTS